MSETPRSTWCAIGAWKWIAGVLFHDVWIKPRGPLAVHYVEELLKQRFESVKVDTVEAGMFTFGQHDGAHWQEFLDWNK